MATVVKVNYDGTLRRFTLPARNSNGPVVSLRDLQVKVRELFNIPAGQLALTYKDKDGDVVTMASDDDLEDACVVQGLNPLYVTVKLVSSGNKQPSGTPVADSSPFADSVAQEATRIRQIMDAAIQNISPSADAVRQLLPGYEPLLKAAQGPVTSGFIDVMEHLVKSLKSMQANAGPPQNSTKDGGVHTGPGASSGVQCPCPSPGLVPIVPASEVPPRVQCPCPAPGLIPLVPAAEVTPRVQCPCPAPALTPVEPYVSESPKKRGSLGSGKDWHSDDSQSAHGGAYYPPDPHPANQVFHNGVQCDGCGICPIVGSRFKSLKKYDFDLCQSCFNEIGKDDEYERYDRPVRHRPHMPASPCFARQARYPAFQGTGIFSSNRPCYQGYHFSRGPYGGKPVPRASGPSCGSFAGKLDARFVQDVSIFDGTEFAPATNFTKIWRLRNSGTAAWPQHTQLVHVGGDELGAVSATSLELPENGLAPEAEVEASVDLVAPERPGRYVSHWRLQAPSGQKFGHRVWVLIQVVAKGEESPQIAESLYQEDEVPGQVDTEVETQLPVVRKLIAVVEERAAAAAEDSAARKLLAQVGQSTALNLLSAVGEVPEVKPSPKVGSEELAAEAAAVDSSELEGFSMVEMPSGNTVSGSAPASPRSVSSGKSHKSEVSRAAPGVPTGEETDIGALLLKLEVMGFTERTLNAELLEKNEFDLQQTVNDLVSAAEWDPILEELEEMGFFDAEMNRRLMFKNNGSVKRVVKELVQIYKAPSDTKPKEQEY